MAKVLNSPVHAEDQTAPMTATVRHNIVRPHKLMRSCPEVVSYLLEKYATDAAIAKYDATVLRYRQLA